MTNKTASNGLLLAGLLAALVAGFAPACKNVLPQNQARLEQVEADRQSVEADLEAVHAAVESLRAQVQEAQASGDAAAVADLIVALNEQTQRMTALEGELVDLREDERTIRAEDAGQQSAHLMQLLQLVLLGLGGGGAGAAALSKLTPSRASEQVRELERHLASVEGQLEGFRRGLETPTPLPPADTAPRSTTQPSG